MSERGWAERQRAADRDEKRAYGVVDEVEAERDRYREALERIAGDMERAAELHERDRYRPVTAFDARRWAEELREALNGGTDA